MTNNTATMAPPIELLETENQLRQVIQTLIEMGIIVHDFQGTDESKEGLVERVNLLTRQLDELSLQSTRLNEEFPVDVVQYIENGRNPDVYTREFVELAGKQNQYINGKMKAMGEFRDILGDVIKEAYPNLEAAVENVKRRTTPPKTNTSTEPEATAATATATNTAANTDTIESNSEAKTEP